MLLPGATLAQLGRFPRNSEREHVTTVSAANVAVIPADRRALAAQAGGVTIVGVALHLREAGGRQPLQAARALEVRATYLDQNFIFAQISTLAK